MTQKILIIVICVAVGTTSGYMVMKTFKRNLGYLTDLCALLDELKRNISYRSDGAAEILGRFAANAGSVQLKKNIAEYVDYASSKSGTLSVSRGFLSKDVYTSVNEFFASLGEADRRGQLDALGAFSQAFEKYRERAAERSNKYGTLSVKLGFLFGLGAGVLFL